MKVIESLGKRRILLKGTNTKINSQVGGFLNFFRTLMTAGLPLTTNKITPLAKRVLMSLGLTAGMSATNAAI